jgi:hypothetical protein
MVGPGAGGLVVISSGCPPPTLPRHRGGTEDVRHGDECPDERSIPVGGSERELDLGSSGANGNRLEWAVRSNGGVR